MCTIMDLPVEIQLIITSADNLDQSTRYTASLTCKHLAGIIFRPIPTYPAADLAARDGNLEILKWAVGTGNTPTAYTMRQAAMFGHLHIIQHLHAAGIHWDRRMPFYAAKNGHLPIIEYAYDNKCPLLLDELSHWTVSQYGHLHILKFMYKKYVKPYDPITLYKSYIFKNLVQYHCNMAIKHGHDGIIEYTIRKFFKTIHEYQKYNSVLAAEIINFFQYGIKYHAIEADATEPLKILAYYGIEIDECVCSTAINRRSYKILDWLHSIYHSDIGYARVDAIIHNDLPLLQWCESKGL